jgi:hypothetical protein
MWAGANVEQVKAVWAQELGALRPEQIKLGVDACRARRFPPTLPEFLELCRPTADMLGIPHFEAAYREALDLVCKRKRQDECSHPVVWHALAEAGQIGMMRDEDARKVYRSCYDQTVRMAINGQPLREIPKALPAPEAATRAPLSPEERARIAEEALARLRSIGINVGAAARQIPPEAPA